MKQYQKQKTENKMKDFKIIKLQVCDKIISFQPFI